MKRELKAVAAAALKQDEAYPLIAPLVAAATIGDSGVFDEVDEKLATRWANNSTAELTAQGFDGAAIIAEARQRQAELEKITHKVFQNFLELF